MDTVRPIHSSLGFAGIPGPGIGLAEIPALHSRAGAWEGLHGVCTGQEYIQDKQPAWLQDQRIEWRTALKVLFYTHKS